MTRATFARGRNLGICLLFASLAAASIVSCRRHKGSGQANSGWDEALREELVPRAAFDLDCASVTAKCLNDTCQQAGVQGCGKRATYVFNRYGGNRGEWLMNNALTQSMTSPPTSAAPANSSVSPQ